MITAEIMGGLGNQLFQIFTAIAYALRSEEPFSFLNIKELNNIGCTARHTYWDTFLVSLKKFTTNQIPEMHLLREEGFVYKYFPVIKNVNIKFLGYFQSYKYFENEYNNIIKLIRLNEMKDTIKSETIIDLSNVISIHFRVGDYKHLQHIHPIMPYEYYKNGIKYILDNSKTNPNQVLYFCEKSDYDDVIQIIDKLKSCYTNLEFICINFDISDWEQMITMSLCKYNVIANSTFSWWGGYFNTNKEKIICYPTLWFGPGLPHNTNDLFPPSWKKIHF